MSSPTRFKLPLSLPSAPQMTPGMKAEARSPSVGNQPIRLIPRELGTALGRYQLAGPSGKTGKGQDTVEYPTYAVLRVTCAFNNTFVTLTDVWGTSLTHASVGSIGISHRQRLPGAAYALVSHVMKKAQAGGVRFISLVLQGPGRAHAACLAAYRQSLTQSSGGSSASSSGKGGSLSMVSLGAFHKISQPHNGCRAPSKRRKRRKTKTQAK